MSRAEERREGTCCWSSLFNGRISKLHCSYYRLKWLQSTYVAMSGLEGFIVILLLLASPVECEFKDYYQARVVPVQIVTALVFQVISGLLTDKTAKYAHRVLSGVCFCSLLLDPMMFFMATHNPDLVLVTFVIRFGLIVQLGTSTGKIMKMRLDKLNMSEENQVHVFNNTTVAGDVVGRLSTVIFGFSLSCLLIYSIPNIGFERIKIIFFAIAFFWDCVSFVVSLFIDRDYFYAEEEPEVQEFAFSYEDSVQSIQEPSASSASISINSHPTKKGYSSLSVSYTDKAFEDETGKRVTYQELYVDNDISRRGTLDSRRGTFDDRNELMGKRGTLDDRFSRFDDKLHTNSLSSTLKSNSSTTDTSLHSTQERKNDFSSEESVPSSLSEMTQVSQTEDEDVRCAQCTSCRTFFGHSLLWSTTLHLLVNVLVAGFVAIVLRFDIAGGGHDDRGHRNDFCNGQLTSLLELQAISDCVRLIGSFFYQGILTRMTPYTFYTSFYMFLTLLSMLLFSLTFFPLPSVVGNIILSYLNVASYLTTNYDNSIIGAVVPPQIVGFCYAVQGVSIQLIGFIPVGLATLVKHVSMPRWSVTTILTSYIFFTLVYGFFFVKFQKKALQKLESPKEGPNEENCFERAFNRIFTKIMGNTESNTPRSSIN